MKGENTMEKTIIGAFEITLIDNERIEIRPLFHGKAISNVISVRNIDADLIGILQGEKVRIDNQKIHALNFYVK